MGIFNRPARLASFILIGLGAVLLAVNILTGSRVNLALPLVFLMLGGMFCIIVWGTRPQWAWAPILYIPGGLLLALGVIFLLNTLTGDWNAWAYAWLLLLVGAGAGAGLASRDLPWPLFVAQISWGAAAVGLTLFALFGAIAGGLFIQIMAPILLILGGLSLRWLPLETLLPEPIRQKLHIATPAVLADPARSPNRQGLIEPLSTRELEVLNLVDAGLSNQQIALKLNVAGSTVKTHINNIYGKLNVETRVQAIHKARDLGLLD